jgi:hypothetical protein
MPINKVSFSSSAFCSWLFSAFMLVMFSCAQHHATEIVPAVHAAPANEIEQQLEQARSNLAVSMATEERIASELKTLKQFGKANPDDLKNYEIYLSRVQAMVAENQKIVDEMEKAFARHTGTEKTDGATKAAPPAGASSAAMVPEREAGDLDTLDRKLGDSLSEFDQMLLKEMDEIRAKSENRMSTLAQEAASAAKRIGGGEGESSEAPGESSTAEGGGEEGAGEEGEEGEQGSRKSGQGESGGSYGNVPVTDGPVAGGSAGSGTVSGQGGRPSGSDQDDDIVARQLREAAEKETDPELKKKLWKEYEDYKKASR